MRHLSISDINLEQRRKDTPSGGHVTPRLDRRLSLRDQSGEEKSSAKSIVGYDLRIFSNPEGSTSKARYWRASRDPNYLFLQVNSIIIKSDFLLFRKIKIKRKCVIAIQIFVQGGSKNHHGWTPSTLLMKIVILQLDNCLETSSVSYLRQVGDCCRCGVLELSAAITWPLPDISKVESLGHRCTLCHHRSKAVAAADNTNSRSRTQSQFW